MQKQKGKQLQVEMEKVSERSRLERILTYEAADMKYKGGRKGMK